MGRAHGRRSIPRRDCREARAPLHTPSARGPMAGTKLQLIDFLGDRAAATLRGAELGPGDEERLIARLLELRRLTSELSRELAPRQVAATVLDRALALLGARSGTISWLVAPDTLSLLYGRNVPDAWTARFERLSVHEPYPAGAAVVSRNAIWLETEGELARRFPGLLPAWRAAGGPTWASIPLVLDDAPVGVLGVSFDPGRRVDALDRAFAIAIAQECANALERARLYEEERALRARAEESGALLEAFIANIPTGLAFVDPELRYVRVNPALAAMNGVAAEAHVGKRVREVLSDPLWADQVAAAEAALRDAVDRGISHLDMAQAVELPPQSGRVRHFLTSTYPVRTPSGALLGAGASVRDVTALREAQRAREQGVADLERALASLRASEALLDSVFDHAPIGLGFLDRSFRFIRVNRNLAEMNGLPPEVHVGKTPRELLPVLSHDALEAAWRRVLDTGEPLLGLEVSGETPAAPGRLRHWVEDWYRVEVEGNVIGLGAVVREVTEQRRAEELQRLLVGIVGHDIRNPLGVIATSAALLAQSSLDPRQEQVVARIRRASESIGSLAQQLLDYTVIRAGRRVPIAPRETDFGRIVGAIVDDFRALHPDRAIRADAVCAGTVVWDEERIRRLLANLLSNAVKYGDPAAPIAIVCREDHAHLVLDVTNRGAPIPPDRLARIFEPLQQGDDGARRGGIGLGLFIAREIAHAHGGSIDVRSADDATTFTVRLPRRAAVTPG
jgi:PAS domain S-box-containing protein